MFTNGFKTTQGALAKIIHDVLLNEDSSELNAATVDRSAANRKLKLRFRNCGAKSLMSPAGRIRRYRYYASTGFPEIQGRAVRSAYTNSVGASNHHLK
jgi:hypothetical protein